MELPELTCPVTTMSLWDILFPTYDGLQMFSSISIKVSKQQQNRSSTKKSLSFVLPRYASAAVERCSVS